MHSTHLTAMSRLDLKIFSSKVIIAVDGHSGCGKSTTAKQVASRLGYTYIDTGAMYRAVTLFFLQHSIQLSDVESVNRAIENVRISFEFDAQTGRNETYLNGSNVEDEIRNLNVANLVSKVSALPEVRSIIMKQQVEMGKNKGIVMDGRDIGTQVFPSAELKVFMTADPFIRAQRRQVELVGKGHVVDFDEILDNIRSRDHDDTTRLISPLRQADDALLFDTSFTTIDEQVDWVVRMAKERINNRQRVIKRQPQRVAS